MTKLQKEQEHARDLLLNQYKVQPGETVYTKVLHVSKSGMMRVIDAYIMRDNEPVCISYSAAQFAGRYNERHEGVEMGGCGMDMGFTLVYNLSYRLFGDGYHCLGEDCPSPDHQNERDSLAQREEHWRAHTIHKDGYALKQRWI